MGIAKEKETMPPEFEALAKRVKAIRKLMDENQIGFAEHCGINVETLSPEHVYEVIDDLL